MIKTLLLSLTLILSANTWGENLRFGLSCKILDQIVMEMDEGKSKRYSSYEGELKTGDSFYLQWEITEISKNYPITIKIQAGDDDKRLHTFYMDDSNYQDLIPWSFHFDSSNEGEAGSEFVISDDYITANDSGNGQMLMRRYYKNDWSFSMMKRLLDTFQIVHANCMGMPDDYDKFLKVLEERHGKRSQ